MQPPRELEPNGRLRLSREQRKRVLGGDYGPLLFPIEPECERGTVYVLSWSRETRSHVGEGEIAVTPAMPLRWLTVTRKTRRTDGKWLVEFDVVDQRDSGRLLRAAPPVYDAETMKGDQDRTLDDEEIDKARIETNYTTNPLVAIDKLRCVDDVDLDRFTTRAREKEREAAAELLATALVVQGIVRERMKSARFRELAGLSVHKLDKEVSNLIVRTRRKAA